MRRPRGFRNARARAARCSLREKNLAWTESQAVHQGNNREASRVASQTGPAQYLGSDAPCRVLEVCRAAKNRRREAWLVRAQRKQFLRKARKRQVERGRLERRQEVAGARTPGHACYGGESIAHRAGRETIASTLRRSVSRYLSCRTDTAASSADGALISVSVVAVTEQERTCPARPEKGELLRSPTHQPRDTRRRSPT